MEVHLKTWNPVFKFPDILHGDLLSSVGLAMIGSNLPAIQEHSGTEE